MLLKNAQVFLDGDYQKADLRIEDGIFIEIQPQIAGEGTDCSGKKIIPGLFDIHTHGCISFDFSASSSDQIHKMCEFYAAHGVTSVLATTMTNEDQQYHNAMVNIRKVMKDQESGHTGEAKIQGINMEGPFFGPSKKGAHDEQYLRPISQELFEEYQQLSGNAIRLLDVDPTLEHAIEFIRHNSKDCIVSLAHTPCTFEEAKKAVEAGAKHVTHLFNAMQPMLHREPGLVGAASEFGLDAEIICDGIHIHPAVIRLMFNAMAEHMVLISDSIIPTGLSDGFYTVGGLPVEVKNGRAFLTDGTLAGSTITLLEAVRNVIRFGVPEKDAILSATYRPARSVGLENQVGSIKIGRSADLLILNDELELEQVMVAGSLISPEQ